MLTLDFEHCIDECIGPLDYRRQYCDVQRPLEIYEECLVAFSVLPIVHMIQLQQMKIYYIPNKKFQLFLLFL